MVAYILAATLVRAADGGAAVGFVLLAGPRTGGLLAAALTAPHLLGPLVARRLDAARDGRLLLGAAYALYGAAVATATLLVHRAPVIVAGALVAVAGTCGPLLTGGLSSRLAGVAPDPRRGEGWDAVTYGIGGGARPPGGAPPPAAPAPPRAPLWPGGGPPGAPPPPPPPPPPRGPAAP